MGAVDTEPLEWPVLIASPRDCRTQDFGPYGLEFRVQGSPEPQEYVIAWFG